MLLTVVIFQNEAHAEERLYVFFDRAPSVDEIETVLMGKPVEPKMLTRGIRPRNVVEKETPDSLANSGSSGLAMNIEFSLNSAQVEPKYEQHLDNLGLALQRNPELGIKIVGHADASGNAEYNQRLSVSRAISVRNYLIYVHSIAEDRVSATGLGETRPAFTPGTDSRNRRVEFYPQ
ncbi:MAG: OmpA family protein [Minwuia sp.]|uniref:OmpA family protein n=1 Tax=Minwuia sp. TaxID=2493630 RepID=UPI003A86F5B0